MGAASIRHSLRPPVFEGDEQKQDSGGIAPRECALTPPPLSSPAKAGDPVHRGFSVDHSCLWNTGSPGRAGRWHRGVVWQL